MNIPKIKMLILDVDGTMTDNGIYIDENGVESKRYNAKDGVGIYELIKNNIKIGIISHSETVSYTHLTLPTSDLV